ARSLWAERPELAGRLTAPGELPADRAAALVAACDLLVQPYPDGACGRRTTLTAALALGVPVLTNLGVNSEPLWAEGAVALAPAHDPAAWAAAAAGLLDNPGRRRGLGEGGRGLYRDRFDLSRAVETLRGGPGS